ncbi:uncharacterized protein RVIR1_09080 [Candidatus Rickettsiella viridis]|uniref:Uncharacterized protein n=1 Tax=Candidatus Rickettsiella viridis TaxID=676208 RepID=A0A2Z5UV65_9COXI|nr:hypothetical protein [Candidatus Rickettsiella viridis]BBB15388.1 uncharacterized protein RVIR1_09080 [Candidatus Rickettsiella viridis]
MQLLEKITALQEFMQDKATRQTRDGEIDSQSDFFQSMTPEILWEKAKNFISPIAEIDNAHLIELSNDSGKKVYLTVQREKVATGNVLNLYCSEINQDSFFTLDRDTELDEMVDIFCALLFPEDLSYEVTTRAYIYKPEKTVEILYFIDDFLGNYFSGADSIYENENFYIEGLAIETFLEFFLINDQKTLAPERLSKTILSDPIKKLSIDAEKIVDAISLSDNQQIALGKLIDKYDIKINNDYLNHQNSEIKNSLADFRKNLLEKLIYYAKREQVIPEAELTEMARSKLSTDLVATGLNLAESNALLDKVIQSHTQAKIGLEKSIAMTRQGVILAPALIQALNGHADSLSYMTTLITADMGVNQAYTHFIQHPVFVKRFPKSAAILTKFIHAAASPVAKILVISSFFELSEQLANSPLNSPEHQEAKALLLDNSIIFASMFAECLGLELGPGGLLLDLGITIHQLIISANYLREHYHLRTSVWDGVKFSLGFNSFVQEILMERELLRFFLTYINQFSEMLNVHFNHAILKLPKFIEAEPISIPASEFPSFLLEQIRLNPQQAISNIKYKYTVSKLTPTANAVVTLRTRFFARKIKSQTVAYWKRQYKIQDKKNLFKLSFSSQNQTIQEDNIFSQSEKKCKYLFDIPHTMCKNLLSIGLLMPEDFSIRLLMSENFCATQKACSVKPILVEDWRVLTSTSLSSHDSHGRLQAISPLSIKGALGACFSNVKAPDSTKKIFDILFLFNPRYGHVSIDDGPFLENKQVVVLIQDSFLEEIFISEEEKTVAVLQLENFGYLHTLYYWIGHNSYPSVIYDPFSTLTIVCLPLASSKPYQINVTLIDNHALCLQKLNMEIHGFDFKQEIKIDFNPAYFLVGLFNFTAHVVYLNYVIADYKKPTQFYLHPHQMIELNNIQGTVDFIGQNGIELRLDNDSLDANLSVNRNAVYSFIIETSYKLNTFTIDTHYPRLAEDKFLLVNHLSNGIGAPLPAGMKNLRNIFFSQQGWPGGVGKYIKFSFHLPSTNLNLVFQGPYEIDNKNYLSQLIFKKNLQICVFFELDAKHLLLNHLNTFKIIVDKGFNYFLFHKTTAATVEDIKFNQTSQQFLYRDIHYLFNKEYGLVATLGAIKTQATNDGSVENFSNLLPGIPINLKNDTTITQMESGFIRVNHRKLANVSQEVKLLTKFGVQYKGLLPFSNERLSSLQAHSHTLSDPDLPAQSSWQTWIIPGILVTGIPLMIGLSLRYFFRLRQARQTAAIELAVLTHLLAQKAEAIPLIPEAANRGTPLEKLHREMTPFKMHNCILKYDGWDRIKNEKGYYQTHKDKEENKPNHAKKPLNTDILVRDCFEQLPSQLLLLQWCIGMYKKIRCANTDKKAALKTNKVIFNLANALTDLIKQHSWNKQDKKIIDHLLMSLHKVSFLLKLSDSKVYIKKSSQFTDWQRVIKFLLVFESHFNLYLKDDLFSKVNQALAQLNALVFSIKPVFAKKLQEPHRQTIKQLKAKFSSNVENDTTFPFKQAPIPKTNSLFFLLPTREASSANSSCMNSPSRAEISAK